MCATRCHAESSSAFSKGGSLDPVLPSSCTRPVLLHFSVADTAAACLPQVVSDPNMNKSGTYWSWSSEKGSFENVVSDEVADDAKAARLWALSERLVGLS